MRVSIITACFNNKKTLEGTIQSVLQQSYSDIEYIIVDGDSSDGTKEITSRYAGRISQVISEKDEGIYDALNKGIKAARGDVIGFLHADDLFADSLVVQKIVDIFRLEKKDSVYGDLVYVDQKNIDKIVRYWKAGVLGINQIKQGWFPPHPTLFIKRSMYEQYGSFNMSFRIAADYDLMLRFLYDHQMSASYLPEVLVKMRLGGASNRSIKNLYQKSSEDLRILKNHQVPFPIFVLFAKNVSKIPQFFQKHIYKGEVGHV